MTTTPRTTRTTTTPRTQRDRTTDAILDEHERDIAFLTKKVFQLEGVLNKILQIKEIPHSVEDPNNYTGPNVTLRDIAGTI